jgi:hypothetical protein
MHIGRLKRNPRVHCALIGRLLAISSFSLPRFARWDYTRSRHRLESGCCQRCRSLALDGDQPLSNIGGGLSSIRRRGQVASGRPQPSNCEPVRQYMTRRSIAVPGSGTKLLLFDAELLRGRFCPALLAGWMTQAAWTGPHNSRVHGTDIRENPRIAQGKTPISPGVVQGWARRPWRCFDAKSATDPGRGGGTKRNGAVSGAVFFEWKGS